MYRSLPSAHAENLPAATAASRKVLCLPIYPTLEISVVDEIAERIGALCRQTSKSHAR